ncbi:MAG TPA: hypothetical protein VK436_08805 [Methanocella sp.]|nr:hypothetical protein [Methanocella sp.]
MNRKAGIDTNSRKIELINTKVREINDRRRGIKLTPLEDDLDRQELRSYMRILGVQSGNVKLESLEVDAAPRDYIFYATIAVEALIELSIIYYVASLILKSGASVTEYGMSGLLMVIFGYLAYRIYKDLRRK